MQSVWLLQRGCVCVCRCVCVHGMQSPCIGINTNSNSNSNNIKMIICKIKRKRWLTQIVLPTGKRSQMTSGTLQKFSCFTYFISIDGEPEREPDCLAKPSTDWHQLMYTNTHPTDCVYLRSLTQTQVHKFCTAKCKSGIYTVCIHVCPHSDDTHRKVITRFSKTAAHFIIKFLI